MLRLFGRPRDNLADGRERRGQAACFGEHTRIPASRETPYPGGNGDLPPGYERGLDIFVTLTIGRARDDGSEDRHRHPAGRPTRADRDGQGGRQRRLRLGWAARADHRVELEGRPRSELPVPARPRRSRLTPRRARSTGYTAWDERGHRALRARHRGAAGGERGVRRLRIDGAPASRDGAEPQGTPGSCAAAPGVRRAGPVASARPAAACPDRPGPPSRSTRDHRGPHARRFRPAPAGPRAPSRR